MKTKTLIICDLQPDVVQKLPAPTRSLWVDMVNLAIQAARKSNSTPMKIVYTMLKFEDYTTEISMTHPRLGILRKLQAKNPNNAPRWFTSSELSVQTQPDNKEGEHVVTRTTFLPQANDTALLEVLRECTGAGALLLPATTKENNQNNNPNAQQQQQQLAPPTTSQSQAAEVYVCGYGPTVQAMCHLLGDVLAIPNVQILQECVRDENENRCRAFLQHGLLFQEQVVSMAEFLDAMDLLHERIDVNNDNNNNSTKYVCDAGRGGHLSLFMPYLLRDYGYVKWPSQPWYEEIKSVTKKQYYCPLGKRIVDLCDEPQFGSGTRFFLKGRQYLDEKNYLHDLVPEYMPPTFATVEEAQEYAAQAQQANSDNTNMVWFLKKVNQNGGRAVTVTNELPKGPLEEDDQLQAHIPRPLLYDEDKVKCHVKTYQFIATFKEPSSSELCWKLYMHDLFYLATANCPWSTDDLSDDAQITTMRRVRLYEDHAWRKQWNLTERCHSYMQTVLERAIAQGKLQAPTPSKEQQLAADTSTTSSPCVQFEVNSADWMLDEDGRMYLIECNGIPVLYDPNMGQELCTKGLNLYDRLYKENPKTAVVDDHDLLKEAIGLALTGKLPRSSLWKQVATIPHPTTAANEN